MCRTEIHCWTTKRLVQLTLEEQRQQEEVYLDGQRQQEEVTLDEQGKQEKVPLDEHRQQTGVPLDKQMQQVEVSMVGQRQQELVSHIPNKEEAGTSKKIYYELGRFDSSDNLVNCFKCLNAVKDKLSTFEVMLILCTNLSPFRCPRHTRKFTKKYKFEVRDVISILQLVEPIIRFLVGKVQKFVLATPSHERDHIDEKVLLRQVKAMVEVTIDESFIVAFPNHRKEIFEQKKITLQPFIEFANNI